MLINGPTGKSLIPAIKAQVSATFDNQIIRAVNDRTLECDKSVLLSGSVAITEVIHHGERHRILVIDIPGVVQTAVVWEMVKAANKLSNQG